MARTQRSYFDPDHVEEAIFSESTPGFLGKPPRTGRRAEGIRYERKAQDAFEGRYSERYLRSPWLKFRLFGNPVWQWCQPDGLLFDVAAGKITIVEFKLKHCAEAWFQLNHLYLPVLRRAFGDNLWQFAALEVCKWYDCATEVPRPPVLRENPLDVRVGDFGVHIFKP